MKCVFFVMLGCSVHFVSSFLCVIHDNINELVDLGNLDLNSNTRTLAFPSATSTSSVSSN